MGGMAGWVDYTRDLRADRDIVATMAGTVAWRGPDASGLWASPRAVICHHRLAIIDRAAGNQPMVAEENGTPLAVLSYDGEVYNYRQLRDQLSTLGHKFRTEGDTEVVLRAYLQWGESCVDHLDGVFAFAVWDARTEELLLVGDRLGLRSIYYQVTPSGVLFGSEPKAILAHPLVDTVVDEDGLRDALSFTVVPGQAVYRDMRRVEQGQLVRISRSGRTARRYWELVAAPHTDDTATTVATWRELLEHAVAERLVGEVDHGVLLSGGVDSSAIVALATRVLKERGGPPLRTFTLDFTGPLGGPALLQKSRDLPYAAEIAAHFGTEHTEIVLDAAQLRDAVLEGSMLSAQQDRPTPTADFAVALRYLCRTVGFTTPAILSGQQAGLMFGGALGMSDPASTDSGTMPWIAFTQGRTHKSGIGTGLLDPGLLDRLDLPGYCQHRYRETVSTVPVLDGESEAARKRREMRYLSLAGWHEYVTIFDTALTQTAGVMTRWPYCTPQMIQYCFNIPGDLRDDEGNPLEVATAALVDVLPDRIRNRSASPFPIGVDPGSVPVLRERLSSIVDDPGSPVLDLIDLDAVKRMLAGASTPATAWRDRTDIQMVLQINDWLTQRRIRLV
ncbi:asparagine synthase (glutamine-hydrolyzing) [Kibdelosporangium banguiense]|uniref:asparagine synthase (glutamine-hydrolyzing) n=1 Tax=Kibdelosporangium banguiense TaxID=1365924 RepID=A0ABS4TFJ8_9PSEU|nr:asparagine synthase (glutamine-hydrolyzing) [Kibdelosporangium banguiense]MBP2323134.1 asparagine synthase (glutamine-hydrolyzing) [Kibdelosporangium banguiense]